MMMFLTAVACLEVILSRLALAYLGCFSSSGINCGVSSSRLLIQKQKLRKSNNLLRVSHVASSFPSSEANKPMMTKLPIAVAIQTAIEGDICTENIVHAS